MGNSPTIGYEIPLFLLREASTLLEKGLNKESQECQKVDRTKTPPYHGGAFGFGRWTQDEA
jgi:hypothetical protein